MGQLLIIAMFAIVIGFFMQVVSDGFAGFVVLWGGVLLALIAVGGRLIGIL